MQVRRRARGYLIRGRQRLVGSPAHQSHSSTPLVSAPQAGDTANGTGEVRAVSRLYGELATGGAALGLDPATLGALTRPAAPPSGGTKDLVLRVETRYSLGYIKPFPQFRFGSSAERAFGTMGTGGSFGFADPDTGIGFAYAMNRSGFRLWDDPRELALRNALYVHVLGERPQLPD